MIGSGPAGAGLLIFGGAGQSTILGPASFPSRVLWKVTAARQVACRTHEVVWSTRRSVVIANPEQIPSIGREGAGNYIAAYDCNGARSWSTR